MAQFFVPRDVVHRPRLGKRERLAVGAAAVPLSATVYKVNPKDMPTSGSSATQFGLPAKFPTAAVIQVLTNAINFTTDGTTPTAALGFQAAVGDMIYLNTIQEITAFQAIQNSAGANIEVQYFYGF